MANFDDLELPPGRADGLARPQGPVDPGPMDRQARSLVMASLLMITVAVAGVGLYSYDRIEVAMRMNAYGKKLQEEQAATRQMTETEINGLKKMTAAFTARLTDLKTALPDTNEVPSMLDSLQRLAATHQVNVVKISPKPKQLDSLFTTHPVQVVLSGRFLDVTATINDLRSMPRLFIPVRMTVEPKTKGVGTTQTAKDIAANGIVDADIMFNTYTIPTANEKALLGAADKAGKGTRRRGKESTS